MQEFPFKQTEDILSLLNKHKIRTFNYPVSELKSTALSLLNMCYENVIKSKENCRVATGGFCVYGIFYEDRVFSLKMAFELASWEFLEDE